MKPGYLIVLLGISILGISILAFIGGYPYLTRDGDYSRNISFTPYEHSANIKYFNMTGGDKFEMLYEAANGTKYSTSGDEGAYPIEQIYRLNETQIRDLTAAGNDGYFSGSRFYEDSRELVEIKGVVKEGNIYYSIQKTDCETSKIPYAPLTSYRIENNTLVLTSSPSFVQYVLLWCFGIFVLIICPLSAIEEIRKNGYKEQ